VRHRFIRRYFRFDLNVAKNSALDKCGLPVALIFYCCFERVATILARSVMTSLPARSWKTSVSLFEALIDNCVLLMELMANLMFKPPVQIKLSAPFVDVTAYENCLVCVLSDALTYEPTLPLEKVKYGAVCEADDEAILS
jgi:hypothetical protein